MLTDNQNENQKADNVIDLFEKKAAKAKESSSKIGESSMEEWFSSIMRRNSDNEERQKKDRVKANKGVIRTYRLLKK